MHIDEKLLFRLNEIGIALSKERRIPVLLEKILLGAKELTGADGGTIYTITSKKMLHFEMAFSDSLALYVGSSSPQPVPFADLPLFLSDGSPNDTLMVAYAVNHKKSINIKDAYHEKGFDFSGTRSFDEKTGYRTRSVLTIPIKNHLDEVIAVLQLINPLQDRFFTEEEQHLVESLASQAGMAITNQLLIQDLKSLFDSFIRVIAEAIDEKSPTIGHHSKRVPLIALLLAEAVHDANKGPFKETHFSEEELYELKIASLLHDCGKITTPNHIVEHLSLPSGNLTEEEKKILQHHVVMTYRMLSQIHFPKELPHVAEIASSHHERMDGKGFPRGLTKEQLSVQARILALANVFEALSAPDHPSKTPLSLSKVLQAMETMAGEGQIDPDLLTLFVESKVYLPYARHYLIPEQIDV